VSPKLIEQKYSAPAITPENADLEQSQLSGDKNGTGHLPEPNYSPEPILSAAEDFRGSWVMLDRSQEIDAGQFIRGWKNLAAALVRCGLSNADRVVMSVGNGPLFPAALAAIISVGGSPLLTHCETPPAELHRTAARFGARFILCDYGQESHLSEIANRVQTVSTADWSRVLWAELPDIEIKDLSYTTSLAGVPLHPTSGTTGHARVAARPGAAAMAEARHWVESVGVDRTDTIMAVPPMSHAYAFGGCVTTPLLSSARVITMRRFSPKLVFRALEQCDVTLLTTVPVTLDLLMFGAGDRLRRQGMKVITAGSPLSRQLAARFKNISGITVRPLYGTTETGAITVGPPDFEVSTHCVGLPFGDVEVRILPSPAGAELGDDAGLVCVRSPSMMAGYVDDDLVDASPLVNGWFRTGDIGRIDSFGMIHLLGRETDVINVYGMKIIPSEVEEVIAAMADVIEVKVYAGQRSDSQYVKASIVGNGSLNAAAVRAHCEKHLVYYKRPEIIHMVESLPRTPSGKIIINQLP
jgi:long-chain acyl-CoA synthetase